MMGTRIVLIVALLAAPACGEAPEPGLSASITISAALSELVNRLEIYVLGRWRSDQIELTCSTLAPGASNIEIIEPTDERVEQLADTKRITFDGTTNAFTIEDVSAGPDRVIFVAAFDSPTGGLLVGRGCQQNQEVPSGGSVDVLVPVYPIP